MLNLYQIGALIFLYKKTPVGSINDIAEVVEKSAVINHAQLVGEPSMSRCTTGVNFLRGLLFRLHYHMTEEKVDKYSLHQL